MSDYDAIFESVSTGNKPPQNEYDSIMQGLMPKQADAASAYKTQTDTPKSVTDDMSTYQKTMAGVGKAFVDLGRGVGQYIPQGFPGHVSAKEIADARQLDAPLMDTRSGKVGNLVGGMALAAPTAFVPGANTVTGAGLIGSAIGLLQPSISTKETVQNTLLGAAGGAGGQYIGGKVINALGNKLTATKSLVDETNAFNAIKDSTLKAGQKLGYVVSPSEVNPSFTRNIIESVAGKAATKQEAAIRNQAITNKLVAKEAGLTKNTPLSGGALDAVRADAGKVYESVGKISPIAKQDLEALKQARFDANAEFKFYNRTADPATLKKAKGLLSYADDLEASLAAEAKAAGKDELIPALKSARTQIAKTYDIERTMNVGSSDASAPVLGRMLDKGKPLSGDLKTIAAMQQAYPSVMREAAGIPAPGVNQLSAMASPTMAAVGSIATGNPLGAIAGGLPLLGSPARSLVLSKPYQSLFANIPKKDVPKTLTLLEFLSRKSKPLLPYAGATGLIDFAQE